MGSVLDGFQKSRVALTRERRFDFPALSAGVFHKPTCCLRSCRRVGWTKETTASSKTVANSERKLNRVRNDSSLRHKNSQFLSARRLELRDSGLVKSVRVKLRGVETLFSRTGFYRRIKLAECLFDRLIPAEGQNAHTNNGVVRGTGRVEDTRCLLEDVQQNDFAWSAV